MEGGNLFVIVKMTIFVALFQGEKKHYKDFDFDTLFIKTDGAKLTRKMAVMIKCKRNLLNNILVPPLLGKSTIITF